MTPLDEQYAHGYHGAMFTVETADDMWRLGALDQYFKPMIRGRLEGCRRLIDSCDNRVQLAEDALMMSRDAADYAELRQRLFFDSTQHGPEPPWRHWRMGYLAVRIRPRIHRCEEVAMVVSPGEHRVPEWAQAWQLTTFANPHDPGEEGTVFPVTLYRTAGQGHGKASHLVDAPAELEEHPEWYRQLLYAFLAMDVKVRMGATVHEDSRRRIIEGRATTSEDEASGAS